MLNDSCKAGSCKLPPMGDSFKRTSDQLFYLIFELETRTLRVGVSLL